jgi:DNA-binding transcriptional MerR regulator
VKEKTRIDDARPGPYRIKDLIAKTGLTKETIHYYILEGLLPKAVKTSRNMAWYSDAHVERLQTIKELQEREFLPLKAIKAVLTGAPQTQAFTPAQRKTLEMIQQKLLRREDGEEGAWVSLTELRHRFNVTAAELRELQEAESIAVRGTGERMEVAGEDEPIVRLWTEVRDLGFTRERGFTAADVAVFVKVAKVLFEQELQLITSRLQDIAPEELEAMIERGFDKINEIMGLLHRKELRKFVRNYPAAKGD